MSHDPEAEARLRKMFDNMTPEQRRGAYRLANMLLAFTPHKRLFGDVLNWIQDADGVPSFEESLRSLNERQFKSN